MMRQFLCYLLIAIFAIGFFSSCNKDSIKETESPGPPEFPAQYTTGFIKFTYTDTLFINGRLVGKDTTVQFTSVGNNAAEKEYYGYFDSTRLQTHIDRLFESDFQFSAYVYIEGVNLNAITYPYTFKPAAPTIGGISATFFFIKGGKDTVISGSPIYVNNLYAAFANDRFSFTLKSNQNGRLQGNFNGVLENPEGRLLKVRNGAFDIKVIER